MIIAGRYSTQSPPTGGGGSPTSLGPAWDFMGPFNLESDDAAISSFFAHYAGDFELWESKHWGEWDASDGTMVSAQLGNAAYNVDALYYCMCERRPDLASGYGPKGDAIGDGYNPGFIAAKIEYKEEFQQFKGAAISYKRRADSGSAQVLGLGITRADYLLDHRVVSGESAAFLRTGTSPSDLSADLSLRWINHMAEAALGAYSAGVPSLDLHAGDGSLVMSASVRSGLDICNDIVDSLTARQALNSDGALRIYNDSSTYGGWVQATAFQHGMTAEILRMIDHVDPINTKRTAITSILRGIGDWLECTMLDPVYDYYFYTENYLAKSGIDRLLGGTTSFDGGGDLPGWYLNLWGRLYWGLGDTTFRDRALRIMATMGIGDGHGGLGNGPFIYNYKQWNEDFIGSYAGGWYLTQTPLSTPNWPVYSSGMSLSGTPKNGNVLTANAGAASGSTGVEWKWYRFYGVQQIFTNRAAELRSGQTGSTYTCVAGDIGFQVYPVFRHTSASGVNKGTWMRGPLSTTVVA